MSETLMPAGLQLEEHAHQPGQICFVLEGEYEERVAGRTHLLSPGRVQLRAPEERHANAFSGDSEVLTLLVSIDSRRWLEMGQRRPLSFPAALGEVRDEIRNELTSGDAASRAALEGLALLLLSRAIRSSIGFDVREPAWVGDAVALIENRNDSALSLASVAVSVGVHRAMLAAAFRKYRLTSVGEYLRHVRLRKATAMLRVGKPLDEIAMLTGFADQAHFGRVFKKATGLTPGQARTRST